MVNNSLLVMYVIGFHALVMSVSIIYTDRNARISRLLLSMLLAIEGVRLIAIAATHQFPDKLFFSTPFALLRLMSGPVLYLYVLSICHNNFSIKTRHVIHITPYLVCVLGMLIYGLSYDADSTTKEIFYDKFKGGGESLVPIIAGLMLLIYSFLSLKEISKHSLSLKNFYSQINIELNFRWVMYLSICYFIVGVMMCVTIAILLIFDTNVLLFTNIFVIVSSIVVIYLISIFGVRQSLVFDAELNSMIVARTTTESNDFPSSIREESRTKYQNSALNENSGMDLFNSIKNLVEKEKLYLNRSLKLVDISNQIETPSQYISQVINQYTEENFYVFINKYRIEHAKHLIQSKCAKGSHLNISVLGEQSGFSSNS